jgi:hypothetical protein
LTNAGRPPTDLDDFDVVGGLEGPAWPRFSSSVACPAAACGPVRDVGGPGRNGRDVSQAGRVLAWVGAFTSRGKQQRELGIGVRGPEVPGPLGPLTAARHDLDRGRPGRRADLANQP